MSTDRGLTPRAQLVVMITLSIAAAAPLLITPILPLQDFAAHCATTQALLQRATYAADYRLNHALTHSWLYFLTAAALSTALGSVAANKLLLAAVVAGFPLAAFTLARRATGRGLLAGAAALGVTYSTSLSTGFAPFLASVTAALLFASDGWTHRLPGRGREILIAAVGAVVTYYLHLFGCGLFLVLLVSRVFFMGQGRGARRLWPAVSASACSLGLLLGSRLAGSGAIQLSGFELASPASRLLALPNALTLATRHPLDDLVIVLLLLLLIVAALAGLKHRWDSAPNPVHRALGVSVALFLVMYLALPDFIDTPRILLAGTRAAPLVLVLLAASIRWPRRWTRGLELSALALGSAAALLAGIVIVLEGRDLSAPAARIEALSPGRTVASLTLHRPYPGGQILTYAGLHLPAYYQATGRGLALFSFYHQDSPVLRSPRQQSQVELATKDIPTYLRKIAASADIVVGDFGDARIYQQALRRTGFSPCEDQGPGPWRYYRRTKAACFAASSTTVP